MGAVAIRISGGEPLLRGDLPILIRAIRDSGMVSMVCTAGNQNLEQLVALIDEGLDILSFSIDMVEPKAFSELRGYPIEPVLKNLEALATLREQRKFEIIVSSVLTQMNVDLLADLLRLVRRLDLLLSVTPFQDGDPGRRSPMRKVAFSSTDGARIDAAVRQLKEAATTGVRLINDDNYLDGFQAFLTDRQLPAGYVCRAGETAAIRMADGSVKLCHSLGSLNPESLSTAWVSPPAKALRERMARLDCPRCWLSCHVDERRPVLQRYGRPQLWEAL